MISNHLRSATMDGLVAMSFHSEGEAHFESQAVLVTLLRCIVNCTAYPIQELCGPFPQKQGLGSQGTRMAFSNIDGESVEGMKSN